MFKVLPINVAAPPVPEVVRLIGFCLELNDVQSVEDRAPLAEPEAVGIFKVITGVVVPVATVEDTSAPVVPKVKAATDVTVPTVQDLLADKSKEVPLIVIVLVVGTPPRPDNE